METDKEVFLILLTIHILTPVFFIEMFPSFQSSVSWRTCDKPVPIVSDTITKHLMSIQI